MLVRANVRSPRATVPTVDPEVISSLFAVVGRLGIDGPALWRSLELPPPDGGRVPLAHDLRFRGALAAATGDPDVGVTLAGVVTADDYGLLGATFRVAPTLRAALDEVRRLLPLWQQGPRLDVDGDTATWTPPTGFDALGTDVDAVQTVFALARIPQMMSGALLPGITVTVGRPLSRPPDPWTHDLTICEGSCWSVRFPVASLDHPRSTSAAVRRALRDAADRALLASTTPPHRAAVTAALGDRPQAATLREVARALGRSERALQRDLRGEATSFREVRDAECLRRAAAALTDGASTIDAVAADLGFASTPAFTRAFRRWTGIPPARWRRRAAEI